MMRKCNACGHRYDEETWTCPACGHAPGQIAGFPTMVEDSGVEHPREFDEETYRQMTAYEDGSFYITSRFDLMYWCFRRFFPDTKRFLDFGGGTGFWLEALATRHPEIDLFGSDLAVESLHNMKRRLGDKATIFHTDAEHLPFDAHFDLIGSFDVVEHIEDDIGVIEQFRPALRDGGGIMLTVPQHMSLWSVLDDKTGHKRRYVGDELARKVRKAGFDVLLDTSFMASLFVPQWISRRFMSQSADSVADTEHSLPGPLNAAFRAALVAELATIKAGARYPFGGMRIVAARKLS
ncbi:MAG: methyltransferase domain-containing protein [Rhodospirillales bacterium]|nr:methyltransferase domain-containing protein [Rhodospirillales bacterium]MBO6786848.1 methyltransferase domain-containing protein [Rhodospirillales bacterium]